MPGIRRCSTKGGRRCNGAKGRRTCAPGGTYLHLVPCDGWEDYPDSAGGVRDIYVLYSELATLGIVAPARAIMPAGFDATDDDGTTSPQNWCYLVDPNGERVNEIPVGGVLDTLIARSIVANNCDLVNYDVGIDIVSGSDASGFIGHGGEVYCGATVTEGGGLTCVSFTGAGPGAQAHVSVDVDAVNVYDSTSALNPLWPGGSPTCDMTPSVEATEGWADSGFSATHTFVFNQDMASTCPATRGVFQSPIAVENLGCKPLCVSITDWTGGPRTYYAYPGGIWASNKNRGSASTVGNSTRTLVVTPGVCPP